MAITMKKILVVEDNALNSKLFCEILMNMGFDVVAKKDGHGVIDILHNHKIALIIMDIHLPKISGFELIKTIKQDATLNHIPILAVTAFAMKDEIKAVRDSGCDDCLIKPISVMEFQEIVGKYLDIEHDGSNFNR